MARITALALVLLPSVAFGQPPQTAAERTNFRATTRYADVVAFCEQVTKLSPRAMFSTFGVSHEGRKLPLLVLADPPVATAAEAVRSGKPVVLVFANIHAGEVDGKEALLALARDLATSKEPGVLRELVVLIVPTLNADGNEKVAPKNRPDNGPAEAGVRENAQGFDLNRDFVKLESPEVRALVRLMTAWNPAVAIDCHTTNGSKHRHTLTYDGPRNPAADPALIDRVTNRLLPAVRDKVKAAAGFDATTYGVLNADRTRWETYPATPRFGVQYVAIRNRIGLLSESYAYAPFKDRVAASRAFVNAVLEFTAANKAEVRRWLDAAAKPRPRVALRTKTVPFPDPVTIRGFDGDRPQDLSVPFVGKVDATLEAGAPFAYLFPPRYALATEALQRHGIKVEELREDIELDCEAFRVAEVSRAEKEFQSHKTVRVEGKTAPVSRKVPAGTVLVRTAQPLGTLAAYLLEPQAEDGLTTWNLFNDGLKAGAEFPVLRLLKPAPLTAGPVRPLPEDRQTGQRIDETTPRTLFAGNPASGFVWLADGEHFLQPKEGKLWKVHARTGRAEPFVDAEKLRKSLATIPGLDPKTADQLARGTAFRMNPARSGALVDVGEDLGFAYFDGRPGVRLTRSKGPKEFASLSPDGARVAFVRDGNLFAVEIAGPAKKQLTADGGGTVLNGKADWVYEEEIFNRDGRAYWWSPDGKRIAFLQFDDAAVKPFTLVDLKEPRGRAERVSYPKAGDPNPAVRIGVVDAAGGKPAFVPLTGYPADATLVTRIGWLPDSKRVFAYLQNRTQTWLDFVVWESPSAEPKKLFRETTGAWVDDPGEPKFLPDGSFLFPSERTGWKHLYHYAADGRLMHPVTAGEWDVRDVSRVDAGDGRVYFTGTRDGPTRTHLYAAALDGGPPGRLTPPGGTHSVSLAPSGSLFIDRATDDSTPARTDLREAGGPVRALDTNPVYEREAYRFGNYDRVRVPKTDGFALEGAVTYPPDFDPKKKYPLWVLTYAGPAMPTVREGWAGGRVSEQVLASQGIVVFRADPRSASGKGAKSAWACYKQLGVQELEDLEGAVAWVCRNPWADSTRVGISGHSYGGFMAAYALTHGKAFSAGIASGPVTDWRLYDTIYTERYMLTPKENPDGYDRSSVVKAAKNLHGRLLLMHGMMDDNVHVQNTTQFADALQRAGKDFEMMLYPQSRHGLGGPHYQRTQLDFIRRTMGVVRKDQPENHR